VRVRENGSVHPNERGTRARQPSALLTLGGALAVVGSAAAVLVSGAFWAMTFVGATLVIGGIASTLWRAIAYAVRPQAVKYDHSWMTNVLGETSTPHRGPEARRPGESGSQETDDA
jgi:hypothetical protein